MEGYIKIGHTQKSHGVKGEIKVFIEEGYDDLLEELELDVFYLKIKSSPVPYFLEQIRGATSNIFKFEDIDSKEMAKVISSKEIYIKADLLEMEATEPLEALEYQYIVNYTIKDEHHGIIGIVTAIEEFPQQEMAVVDHDHKDIYIPLNEHTIVSIDNEKECVYVDLPEGLLDL